MNTSTKHNFFCTKRLGIALKWSDWLNQHLCEFRDLRKFKTFAIYLQEEKTVTSNISPFGQKLRDTRLLIDKEKKKNIPALCGESCGKWHGFKHLHPFSVHRSNIAGFYNAYDKKSLCSINPSFCANSFDQYDHDLHRYLTSQYFPHVTRHCHVVHYVKNKIK